MHELGLTATEFGPTGYLPEDDDQLAALLAKYELSVTGGFVPLVLHDPAHAEHAIATARHIAEGFQRRNATLFVTAAVTDEAWSAPFRLDDAQLEHLVMMLKRLDLVFAEYGITQVLHPHAGTLVETKEDVERVMAASDVLWCIDTGHLAIGGADPVQVARDAGDRVGLVHLKDVDLALAARYRAKELTWVEVVQHGLFLPLGKGDVPVAELIELLEVGGYQGWYVLEQDLAITGDEPAYGTGPIDDVRESVAYLRSRFEVSAAA
jgi:inosose dehydratase